MFIVISHHHCKPGQLQLARERMDKNAAGLVAEPGFLFRHRLERSASPDVLSALTAWNDEADFQRNRQKRFAGPQDLSGTPYERIEVETYQVCSTTTR